MTSYFTRERFGSSQFIAGLVLILFLAQCLWFCAKAPLSGPESTYIQQGQQQWHGRLDSSQEHLSPITSAIASLSLLGTSQDAAQPPTESWRWLSRAPFIAIGMLFGASIWYVARRLYGNVAGYIALVLYAFSPLFVVRATTIQPNMIAAWGSFGLVFTAIGLAHTLYAPREVVLWNWKRILLLGVALGLGTAAQFAVVLLVPIAMLFMWYLVPERRGAATVIMLAGGAVAVVVLIACYGFHFGQVIESAARLKLFHVEGYGMRASYLLLAAFLLRQPTSLLLLLVALGSYFAWKRTRFFGTRAPLIVFALAMLIEIGLPHSNFQFVALPFAYVFISGVMTDLLESKQAPIALGLVIGILLGHMLISLAGLIRM
jgi:Dolichyl-phosphate-mannose-protein mannosyltransferase